MFHLHHHVQISNVVKDFLQQRCNPQPDKNLLQNKIIDLCESQMIKFDQLPFLLNPFGPFIVLEVLETGLSSSIGTFTNVRFLVHSSILACPEIGI